MIICVSNQKGGIAKTTSAINLAACLGVDTLLVDFDPQGACAISLGIDPDTLECTVYDALLERSTARGAIIPTSYGFDLLPANIDLAEAELALSAMTGREYALKRALRPIVDDYQTIIIDTPPTLGLLTVNAFAAADSVLIPVSTQLLSLRGLRTLTETIQKIQRYDINPTLTIAGVLPTKFDNRTIHAREVLEYLKIFGREANLRVFEPVRSTVRFDESTNEHVPFVLRYPDDPASLVYEGVAHELSTQTG